MAKKIQLVDYEVQGYIGGTTKHIKTHVRASNTAEARKLVNDRVPQLIITTVYPVVEF